MPTLITTQPVSPAAMPIVHAAQAARWTVHRTTGGRLSGPASDETAMYGELRTLTMVAQMNRLHLLSPGEHWATELPVELSSANLGKPDNLEDENAASSFEYEFRCFISEGTAVACSPVRHLGKSCQIRGRWNAPDDVFEDAVAFCEELLANPEVASPPAFALDVGLAPERGWVAIAGHPSWSAEIYGCSPSAVLEVLQRSCRTQREISLEDQAWLIG